MSAWRDQLLPASFRGVSFGVKSADMSGGRRVVKHEFPRKETAPFSEDMGKLGRTFTIEAFVIGDDYFKARNALLDALEEEGPGTLIHPYLGTQRVTGTYRMRETSEDGGMAVFSLEFAVTSAELANPTVVADGPSQVAASASAAQTSSLAQFVAGHSKSRFTGGGFELVPMAERLQASSVLDGMMSILDSCPVLPDARAAFNRVLESGGLTGPFDFMAEFVAATYVQLFDGLAVAIASADIPNPSGLFLRLFDFNPGTRPPATTPSRVVERADFDATQHLLQRLAITYAAAAVAGQTFVSYDDATAVRVAITDVIDRHVEAVTDDTFPALADLHSTLVTAIPGVDSDLPRLQHLTPHTVTPSLVLAHTLYGSLDREEDLVRRNGIAHPGFVSGPLEVLTDG